MRRAIAISLILALHGCAPKQPAVPAVQILSSHVTSSSEPGSSWEVKCTDDHHGTAPRQCSAQVDDERGYVHLTVFYTDGAGPYVQAGAHTDRSRANTVRVDARPVRRTEEAQALVADFLHGQKAFATYYYWPYDRPVSVTFVLDGFPAAYTKLQKLIKAPSA